MSLGNLATLKVLVLRERAVFGATSAPPSGSASFDRAIAFVFSCSRILKVDKKSVGARSRSLFKNGLACQQG